MAQTSPTKEILTPPPSNATVTVFCKMPHGLLLDVSEPGEQYQRIRVSGMNAPDAINYGGYGRTANVPKAFWDKWLKKHAVMPYVKNRLVFATDNASGKSEARENAEKSAGFDPLDPNKPIKGIKPITKVGAAAGVDDDDDDAASGQE